jgi:transcriptional regulator with XRE-family HTH domain
VLTAGKNLVVYKKDFNMGTSPKNAGGRNPLDEVPDYALKIRDLRKRLRLTQPQLAAELSVKRSGEAKWEGGVREPRRQNYLALAALANKRHLPEFATFFLKRIEERETVRRKRRDEADDLRYLETVETAAVEGDKGAQHLLELSRLGGADFAGEFAKQHLRRITEARESLENGAFSAAVSEIADETVRVTRLLRARKLRALRRAAGIRRQEDRLTARMDELIKSGEVQGEALGRIFDEIPTLLFEGKMPDIVTLTKRVADTIHDGPRAGLQKRQMISAFFSIFKLCKISELFEEAAAAEEKGEPLDSVQFTKRLEDLLEIGREPKNSKEKK